MEFESEKQLRKCLKWWQKKLFLQDWAIKAILVEAPLLDDSGNELAGQNAFNIESSCSLIRVVIPNDDIRSRICKYCAELTLVHELLHCKYNWTAAPSTFEGVYCDTKEHQLLEQMAKSLIMVKYNLPFDWFKNF